MLGPGAAERLSPSRSARRTSPPVSFSHPQQRRVKSRSAPRTPRVLFPQRRAGQPRGRSAACPGRLVHYRSPRSPSSPGFLFSQRFPSRSRSVPPDARRRAGAPPFVILGLGVTLECSGRWQRGGPASCWLALAQRALQVRVQGASVLGFPSPNLGAGSTGSRCPADGAVISSFAPNVPVGAAMPSPKLLLSSSRARCWQQGCIEAPRCFRAAMFAARGSTASRGAATWEPLFCSGISGIAGRSDPLLSPYPGGAFGHRRRIA